MRLSQYSRYNNIINTCGCTATNTVTINPGSCLNLSISVNPIDVDCNGNSTGSVSSTTTGGSDPTNFSYSWSNGETTKSITVNPSETTIYSVTVNSNYSYISQKCIASQKLNYFAILTFIQYKNCHFFRYGINR